MFGFRSMRITTKFILWFLFIALIPLTVAVYMSYTSSRRVLEEEVEKRLLAVADNKANQIKTYFREKEGNLARLSLMADLTTAAEKFDKALENGVESPEYQALIKEYRPLLVYYQALFGYDDLFIISSEGTILCSAGGEERKESIYEIALDENSELANAFVKTADSLETTISNFEYHRHSAKPAVFIAIPLLREGKFVGTVISRMSNEGISELTGDYSGLGRTGETIIAAKKGEEAVFITPLRFDPEAAFKRRVLIGSDRGLHVQRSFEKESGSDKSVDYRGEKVLAIWRYLVFSNLGMVVKMDTSEIFASANRLKNALVVTSSALLVVVVVMAVLIARSVSGPIKELTRVSGIITGGDLSERAAIATGDEIGELASSFNKMTDSFVKARSELEDERVNLEDQKKLLEKANKELDSFVYTASHDLRAPLRAISSFSGFLEEDYKDKLGKEGKEQLGEIRKGVNRMTKLIDDLLELSRISRIKNPYERVKMNELVASVVERVKFDIDKNKVDLRIQENMPTVSCDGIKMAEVFLNLINNAIKFSSKNKKEDPKIEIGCDTKEEFYEFRVKDNGIGIDPKYHDEIFGIFRRLQTASEYEGTGAGLSIVKRIVEDHGGKVWVKSKPGEGAAFYFTLPTGVVKKKKKVVKVLTAEGFVSKETT